MAYLAQQIVNGIHLGALYALLAFGYAIAHGVLRRASFIHGALFAFAGQVAVYSTAFGWNRLLLIYPAALTLGLLASLALPALPRVLSRVPSCNHCGSQHPDDSCLVGGASCADGRNQACQRGLVALASAFP
ncbi:MAG: hypothetical protein R3D29_12685 [Nitratireductor sp.]